MAGTAPTTNTQPPQPIPAKENPQPMSQNPLPESVTKAQTDEALRALGIPERIGLTGLEITPHRVIVTRWVKDDDRRILGDGPARVEIPINRGRTPDELSFSDDPTEPFSDGA